MANKQADGSIIIDTEIDDKGLAAGSAELQKAIESLTKQAEDLGPVFEQATQKDVKALQKLQSKSSELKDKIENLKDNMSELGDAEVHTSEFAQVSKEVAETQDQLDGLIKKREELKATGKDMQMSEDYKTAQKNYEEYSKQLESLDKRERTLSARGVKENSKQWTNLQADISHTNAILKECENEMANYAASGLDKEETQEWTELSAKINEVSGNLDKLKEKRDALASRDSELKKVNQQLDEAAEKLDKAQSARDKANYSPKGLVQLAKYSNLDSQNEKYQGKLDAAKQKMATAESTSGKDSKEYAEAYQEVSHYSDLILANQEKMDKLMQSEAAVKTADKMNELNENLEKAQREYDALIAKKKELESSSGSTTSFADTQDFSGMSAQIDALEQQLKGLSPQAAKSANSIRGMFGSTIKQITNSWKDTAEGLGDFICTPISDGMDRAARAAVSAIKDPKQALDSLKAKAVSVGAGIKSAFDDPKGAAASLADTVKNKLSDAFSRTLMNGKTLGETLNSNLRTSLSAPVKLAGQLAGKLGGAALSGAKSLGSTLKDKVSGGLKKAVDGAKKLPKYLGSKLVGSIKNAASGLSGMGKSADSLRKKILKASLALLGMRGIWGGIRQLVSSALNNNEQLQNQLTAVKGVLGEALAPAINVLVKGLATLVSFADRLYQTFTGISLISKYNAKQTAKTSSGLNEASKNAKKLTRQLAGFDELNVLSKNDTDSSSGAGGGVDTASLFDPVKLSKEMQDFIDQFKKLWEQGDFYGIGELISSKIVGALQSIDWEAIKAKAFKGGKSFAEILNGLFEYTDADGNTLMSSIGMTIGEALNTLVSFIDGFAANLHWGSLGKELANGISTAIKTIDWKLLLKTAIDLGTGFGEYINGLLSYRDKDGDNLAQNLAKGVTGALHTAFQFILSFIKTTDWGLIGRSIADFIQGIDWVKLFNDVFEIISEAIKGLLDFIIGFIEEMDWDKAVKDIHDILVNFFTKIDWGGILERIARLIGDLLGMILRVALTNITDWFQKAFNLFQIIKDYFDQHIEEAKANGGSVAEGILQGILQGFANIGQWIVDHIFKPFIDGFCKAFGIHSPSTVMKEKGEYLIDGLKSGLSGIWDKVKEKFTELWTRLSGWFDEQKENIKKLGSNVIDNIKSGIGEIWDKLKEKFTAFWTNLKSWFDGKVENFKKLGSNMISKIKTGIGNVWSTIREKFTAFWTSLKGWFDGKVENFKKLGSNMISKIKSGIGNIWSNIKEKFTNFWTSVKSWFDGKVENFKNLGKNIVTGIKDGISGHFHEVLDMIKTKIDGMVDQVKDWLGIHSPSRVFRDEVGQYIALGLGEGIVDSMPEVVKDVATLTGAIEDEINKGDYSISPLSTNGANMLNAGMTDFANIISDGFADLISKLESIARGVTFATPAAANLVPYSCRDNSPINWRALLEASNDDLINALLQVSREQTDELIKAIESLDLTVDIDERAEADRVIKEIKRRTLITKQNPLLTS